jgi:hypothetical protein
MQIPNENQIRAMLDGRVFDLLRDYGVEPERIDFRRLITVRRQDLIDFLSTHSDVAEDYIRKHSLVAATHDVGKIWQEGSEYLTAWLDHGKVLSPHRFKTLGEAVAEHVLVAHGMY